MEKHPNDYVITRDGRPWRDIAGEVIDKRHPDMDALATAWGPGVRWEVYQMIPRLVGDELHDRPEVLLVEVASGPGDAPVGYEVVSDYVTALRKMADAIERDGADIPDSCE